jgi:hypothetical protein
MRFIRVAGLKEDDFRIEWRTDHIMLAMQGTISAQSLTQSFKPSTLVFDVNYPNQEHQKFALYSNKYRWLSTLCKNLRKRKV